uniref:Uncharacterized protein n=1 Tax=Rhodosorus marinus TaxID=101924 RepID=A0A7S3EBV1_9RHOD|mmetsp:Transcript_23719/g.93466  ORF Transcript_23719/g.93466 Transcript_23719/m.93466 type:complete len:133 (+) Transcript_23719:569-967(+)
MDKKHDGIGLVQDSKSLLEWLKDYQFILASGLVLLAACVAVGGAGVAIAVVVLLGATYFGIAGYYLLITLKTPDFVMQYVEELVLSPRMRSIMTKLVQKVGGAPIFKLFLQLVALTWSPTLSSVRSRWKMRN